jgi:hypothetical protein
VSPGRSRSTAAAGPRRSWRCPRGRPRCPPASRPGVSACPARCATSRRPRLARRPGRGCSGGGLRCRRGRRSGSRRRPRSRSRHRAGARASCSPCPAMGPGPFCSGACAEPPRTCRSYLSHTSRVTTTIPGVRQLRLSLAFQIYVIYCLVRDIFVIVTLIAVKTPIVFIRRANNRCVFQNSTFPCANPFCYRCKQCPNICRTEFMTCNLLHALRDSR